MRVILNPNPTLNMKTEIHLKVDPTYVPDPAKVAEHNRLNQSPRNVFIRALSGATGTHLGLRRDMLGARSGLILSVGYVAACSGRQIGGPWGYGRYQTTTDTVCPRCATYAAKHRIDLARPLT
jgi:hypothetical protein